MMSVNMKTMILTTRRTYVNDLKWILRKCELYNIIM